LATAVPGRTGRLRSLPAEQHAPKARPSPATDCGRQPAGSRAGGQARMAAPWRPARRRGAGHSRLTAGIVPELHHLAPGEQAASRPGEEGCGCRRLVHLRRPGCLRGSAHRDDRPVEPAHRLLERVAGRLPAAVPGRVPGGADAGCSAPHSPTARSPDVVDLGAASGPAAHDGPCRPCGCQIFGSHHATCAYSWISPPSRSRRTILPDGTRTAGSSGSSGGACPRARCGRWPL
jgi:hypothetical protein